MKEITKMNCRVPQCSHWDETKGCTINPDTDNGYELCKDFEERYEYQAFVIIKGGKVNGIYSDKPSSDLNVTILDLDGPNDNENAFDAKRARAAVIKEKYHQLYHWEEETI